MEYKKNKANPLTLYFKYLHGNASVMELNDPLSLRNEIFSQLKANKYDVNTLDPVLKELEHYSRHRM
jgi:hypothetical protein